MTEQLSCNKRRYRSRRFKGSSTGLSSEQERVVKEVQQRVRSRLSNAWGEVPSIPILLGQPFDAVVGLSVLGLRESSIVVALGMTIEDFKRYAKDPSFAERWLFALQLGHSIAEERLLHHLWKLVESTNQEGKSVPNIRALIELINRISPSEEKKERIPLLVQVNVGDNSANTRQIDLKARAEMEDQLRQRFMSLPDNADISSSELYTRLAFNEVES